MEGHIHLETAYTNQNKLTAATALLEMADDEMRYELGLQAGRLGKPSLDLAPRQRHPKLPNAHATGVANYTDPKGFKKYVAISAFVKGTLLLTVSGNHSWFRDWKG